MSRHFKEKCHYCNDYYVYFFSVLEHELTVSNFSHSNSSFHCGRFLEIVSCKLFVWDGFEQGSSRSLPPEQLGLQAWVTSASLLWVQLLWVPLCFLFYEYSFKIGIRKRYYDDLAWQTIQRGAPILPLPLSIIQFLISVTVGKDMSV
jgi:hypothetical protein